MLKRVAAFVVFFLCAIPAHADLIQYTFSGANGLSGSFALDGAQPFVIQTDASGTCGTLQSPNNTIAGNFGAAAFSGTSRLVICDTTSLALDDFWIIRSDITGNPVGGKTPLHLSLFIFRSSAGSLPISTNVPDHNFNPFDFQYTFFWSDDSLDGGALESLQQVTVPEGATVATLGIGIIGLVLVCRRNARILRSDS
jgi:hypothetical protein